MALRCASAAAACISSVDLPMPGSPPTSSAEPRTKPPPVARSSSAMPVAMRGASSISPRERGQRHRRGPCAASAAPAGPPPMPPAGAFLDQRVPLAAGIALAGPARMTVPQVWQMNWMRDLAIRRLPRLEAEVGGTAPPSVLPDISPARGEIGSFGVRQSATLQIGEAATTADLPPAGEMSGRTEGGVSATSTDARAKLYSNRSGRWLSSARSKKRVNSPWKPSRPCRSGRGAAWR